MNEETKAAMEAGNAVMIFHINSVGQMNPSATVVNNHYWGDEFVPVEGEDGILSGTVRRQESQKKAEPKAKAEQKAKTERKSCVPKIASKARSEKPRERMTFKKRGIQNAHVKLLYQRMMDLEWIAKENNEQDFLDLFSGELSDCKIAWGEKFGKSTLVFLFRYFEAEGVVAVAKGYTIPNILMGHFVDKDGNYLTHLDNGDNPAPKSGKEAEELLSILKLNAAHQGRRAARIEHDEEDDFSGYGEGINPYELQDEGLRRVERP